MCLAKPPELIALYDDATWMFEAVRDAFGVPARHTFDLSRVDRARSEDEDLTATAALALYYIQSLRVLAKPEVRVRITSIVNTTACLHQVLQSLEGQDCGTASQDDRMLRARERVGAAATAVTLAQVSRRDDAKFMQ
ncbi:hypothetical protein GCM10023201_47820 [Actinomycetospora corticicola]